MDMMWLAATMSGRRVSQVDVAAWGLVSYRKIEEAAVRAGLYGDNDLTDNNTVTQASGKIGNAAQFAVANLEYLSIASNSTLQVADEDFWLAGWVLLNDKDVMGCAIASSPGSLEAEYLLLCQSGASRFDVTRNGGTQVPTVNGTTLTSARVDHFFLALHDAAADTIHLRIDDGVATSQATGARTGCRHDGSAQYRPPCISGRCPPRWSH